MKLDKQYLDTTGNPCAQVLKIEEGYAVDVIWHPELYIFYTREEARNYAQAMTNRRNRKLNLSERVAP